MSEALIASRVTNAVYRAAGSKSASLVHRARYGEAGSCAWTAPIRSSASTGETPLTGASSS
jgi:hypothetical protein